MRPFGNLRLVSWHIVPDFDQENAPNVIYVPDHLANCLVNWTKSQVLVPLVVWKTVTRFFKSNPVVMVLFSLKMMSLTFGNGMPINITDLHSLLGKPMSSLILPRHSQKNRAPFYCTAAFLNFFIKSSKLSLVSIKTFLELFNCFLRSGLYCKHL